MKQHYTAPILTVVLVFSIGSGTVADPPRKIDREKLFETLDTNADNSLSRDEFRKLAKLGHGGLKDQPEMVRELFERLDADKDGLLTRGELNKVGTSRGRSAPLPSRGPAPTATPEPTLVPENVAAKCRPGPFRAQTVAELILRDRKRRKDLPLRVSYPDGGGPFPIIVWSHGMFGSKNGYLSLTEFWTGHGYIVIQPTHSDSLSLDSKKEVQETIAKLKAGQKAGRTGDWMSRPRDVRFVLDSLDEIARQVPGLTERMNRQSIGVGGHSFGAQTTQLVAGTSVRRRGGKRHSFADPRPAAFVAVSPNGLGQFDRESFQGVRRPMLFVTGTNDSGRGGDAIWRKQAYDHAATGDKFLAWVDGAYHDFGGISGAPSAFLKLGGNERGEKEPEQVELVRMVTLAFWDAYLKQDAHSRASLKSGQLADQAEGALKLDSK